ncbi:MAG: hypothetical protein FWD77_05335 [Betaproteobacteria bacterium]|nr:hypothetical protein [Betaproteobacteria bacterium]
MWPLTCHPARSEAESQTVILRPATSRRMTECGPDLSSCAQRSGVADGHPASCDFVQDDRVWPLPRHPARSEAESQDPEEDANPCARVSSARFAAAGRLPRYPSYLMSV